MKATVKTPIGLATFEANISEFCQVVRDLLGASIGTKARQALKAMIEEVDKDFRLVVDVLMPLYAINTAADFRQRFPEIRQNFKKEYLTQWHSLATHCGIVGQELHRVQQSHDWKRHIPLMRNAVKRLADMGQRWMANDVKLYESMNAFMTWVNDELDMVNRHSKTPARALKELDAVLQGTERSLLQIKAYSNELELMSSKLS